MEAALDFSNQWLVSAGRDTVFIGRPSATQNMSADEALILAAWLVAIAEPKSELTFDEVRREVAAF